MTIKLLVAGILSLLAAAGPFLLVAYGFGRWFDVPNRSDAVVITVLAIIVGLTISYFIFTLSYAIGFTDWITHRET